MVASISFSGRECRHADEIFAFPARTEFSVTTGLTTSFMTQSLHRLDQRSSTRRYPACKHRNGKQQQRRAYKCEWIGRLQAKEHGLEKLRQHQRSTKSGADSN